MTQSETATLQITMPDAQLLPRGAHVLLCDTARELDVFGSEQAVTGEARVETVQADQVTATMISGQAQVGAAVITK